MMKLNMDAPFILAYHFGKVFMEKGRGGIIFVSSTSAFQATPYLAHYGATKAYLLSLAESMNYEFKDKGVDVLALCPGTTESEMTRGMKNNPVLMKADVVVKQGLDGLGKKYSWSPACSTRLWCGWVSGSSPVPAHGTLQVRSPRGLCRE